MKRKTILLTAVAASMAVTAPAMAWGYWPKPKPPTSSTSGGNGSTGGSTQVPEPGMLGMMGAALIGLSLVRRRKTRD